jgi:drug/metabolite transporter (DMT)-like permease
MLNRPLVAYFLLALATLSWGGNVVIGRAIRSEIPPFGLSFWRWTLCFFILFVFTAPKVRRSLSILRREWKLIGVMALFGIAGFNTLQYVALHTTTAINVTLILSTSPAFMAVLSMLILKEKLGPSQGIGILTSFIGVAVVISRGSLQSLMALHFTLGDLWMLTAAFVWALYSIAVKMRPADLNPLVMLTAITATGSLMLSPFLVWETMTVGPVPFSTTSVLTIGYVSLVASLLAFISYNKGVSIVGPAKAGTVIHLIPVWVAILAYLFLGERLETFHLIGLSFIALGIFLNSRPVSRPKAEI